MKNRATKVNADLAKLNISLVKAILAADEQTMTAKECYDLWIAAEKDLGELSKSVHAGICILARYEALDG